MKFLITLCNSKAERDSQAYIASQTGSEIGVRLKDLNWFSRFLLKSVLGIKGLEGFSFKFS